MNRIPKISRSNSPTLMLPPLPLFERMKTCLNVVNKQNNIKKKFNPPHSFKKSVSCACLCSYLFPHIRWDVYDSVSLLQCVKAPKLKFHKDRHQTNSIVEFSLHTQCMHSRHRSTNISVRSVHLTKPPPHLHSLLKPTPFLNLKSDL